MNKIIVPVDFSIHSENALKVAAKIASRKDSEIVVVHMMGVNDARITKDEEDSVEGLFLIKLTKKRFTEFLDKDYLEGLKVTDIVRNFKVFSEIDDVAKEYGADLIVMGSHGTSGVSEVFVGSNTEKVVRTASVPVLVIKEDTNMSPSVAVFACDFKVESLEAYQKVAKMFKLLEIKMHLLYVNLPGQNYKSTNEIEKQIVEFIVNLPEEDKILLEDVTIFADYSVEQGVFNFANKVKADLISIPTHGRSGLAHFFSGSIGEDIVNHSKIPVLTVKI
ncbi:universal stress protein [Bizionia paragorgiae]|jgi:nucleotide-binding universal stress UspA family protein|uniref:Nucleotide-binding universal stress protein, UspA family n=1 Tax=Bizionia paragorgiae TaxID=283786 RepID=A0A1H3ZCG4_BIZPA|nr:universal stress protein [Bizionia paragorgiae]MDX1271350.1 universal stress protein [Bizionia paragorgiae]SEA21330.1 Nucleotide-binding universal stress protein, UspA family [Bizionia paragorgiae]